MWFLGRKSLIGMGSFNGITRKAFKELILQKPILTFDKLAHFVAVGVIVYFKDMV
jgi:hypothetical protein